MASLSNSCSEVEADQCPPLFDSAKVSSKSSSSSSTAKSGLFQHRFGYNNSHLYSPYCFRWDEWNQYHGWRPPAATFDGGVVILQPQQVGGGGFRCPPPPHGFMPRPGMPVRAFGNPMTYPAVVVGPYNHTPPPLPPEFRPIVAVRPPPPPAFFRPPFQDTQLLRAKIVSQIEYYFSKNNLVKDIFLRRNMDEEGWVPIKLIAGFRRVRKLTNDVDLVADVLRASSVVEVRGEKVRKRGDWSIWIMQSPAESINRVSTIAV